ncbi:M28 family metallopeptidase [Virgisporangium ochraceum]|uniref:Amidohydrolase n=1 Tax=Virgisporangium ochraceum TaxID=65505 RepID=A0A8J4EEU9_9ACTN|nr:M28 family peptidase [Virgisporangium ochraceum]GIJ72101.1 amidohydrolase [Virgisporangium ochraceum]
MAFGAKSRLLAAAAVMVLVGSLTGSPASAGRSKPDPGNNTPQKLTRAVTLPGLLRHLGAFQFISDTNGNNRGSGLPGYDRSADYVAWTMRLAGYQVTRQPFDFVYCDETSSSFAQTAPTPTTYVDGTDYDLSECSGPGDVTAEVVPVDVNLTPPRASTSGCEPADFTAAVVGKIALLQRGTCPFGQKVTNAQNAGAIGAILMNQGNGDDPSRYNLLLATLGTPVNIPTVGVSYATGEGFATGATETVRITATTTSEIRHTENVIAETPGGNPDNVVMAGGHLDSEPDTTGLNDNGSGSAALLEIAWQMRKVKPTNKVRFAWWGAEESNLVGSTFYVGNSTPEDLARIKLYLNFDMIASANYTLGVYDGDDSAAEGSGPGPVGSAEIEALFERFFASRRLPTAPADFSGRSDYGPFIAAGVGIPAGGLFTGAEDIKTAEDVAKWGGIAGIQKDPCYHDPCDSFTPVKDGGDPEVYRQLDRLYPLIGNINLRALDVNADAIATAVITYAFDTSSIPTRPAVAASARSAPSATVAATSKGRYTG